MPYADFKETALVLDNKRLGKQRVEAYQIKRVLAGLTVGWRNHPAVLMWRGYEDALDEYGREMCLEWIRRGYTDNMLERFQHKPRVILPPWLGDSRLHLSHQSNLIRKYPEHYKPIFPDTPDNLEYYWVVRKENNA